MAINTLNRPSSINETAEQDKKIEKKIEQPTAEQNQDLDAKVENTFPLIKEYLKDPKFNEYLKSISDLARCEIDTASDLNLNRNLEDPQKLKIKYEELKNFIQNLPQTELSIQQLKAEVGQIQSNIDNAQRKIRFLQHRIHTPALDEVMNIVNEIGDGKKVDFKSAYGRLFNKKAFFDPQLKLYQTDLSSGEKQKFELERNILIQEKDKQNKHSIIQNDYKDLLENQLISAKNSILEKIKIENPTKEIIPRQQAEVEIYVLDQIYHQLSTQFKSGESQKVGIEHMGLAIRQIDQVIKDKKEEMKKNYSLYRQSELKQKQPKFIREFSQEQSVEERKKLAYKIKEARRIERQCKKLAKELSQGKIKEVSRDKNQENIEKLSVDQKFILLGADIAELSQKGVPKIKEYLQYKKLQSEGDEKNATDLLKQATDADENSNLKFEDINKTINNFYKKEIERWQNSGYDFETIKKYFSDENVSRLSVQEYALLWKRFPSDIVTHSVRQGVRDHGEMEEHTAGIDEYLDEFVIRLKSGKKLLDAFSRSINNEKRDELLAEFFNLPRQRKKSSLNYLNQLTDYDSRNISHGFSDKSSVHFGVEVVLDNYYGGETNNEIFLVYPSAYIASNYGWGGNMDQLVSAEKGKDNDLFVYSKENQGVPIDAGLVFIPSNTPVDKNTGSKYLLDQNLKPIINEKYKPEENNEPKFLLSNDSITSKEYWEAFFTNHPELKPTKIIYYEEKDPTEAINTWLKSNNIIKVAGDQNMYRNDKNLPDNFIPQNVREEQMERLNNLGKNIIKKYYDYNRNINEVINYEINYKAIGGELDGSGGLDNISLSDTDQNELNKKGYYYKKDYRYDNIVTNYELPDTKRASREVLMFRTSLIIV